MRVSNRLFVSHEEMCKKVVQKTCGMKGSTSFFGMEKGSKIMFKDLALRLGDEAGFTTLLKEWMKVQSLCLG